LMCSTTVSFAICVFESFITVDLCLFVGTNIRRVFELAKQKGKFFSLHRITPAIRAFQLVVDSVSGSVDAVVPLVDGRHALL